jgi:vacuolar-type H+-ATPase subunit H
MASHWRKQPVEHAESALDALLLAERASATQLENARIRAATIIDAAKHDVVAMNLNASDELSRKLSELDATQQQALIGIEQEVTASADRVVSRYHAIGAEDITRIAATVLQELWMATAEGTR